MNSGSSAFIFTPAGNQLHRVDFLVMPEIAARSPADLAAGAANDEHLVDDDILLGGDVDGDVGIFLERHRLSASYAFVASDHESDSQSTMRPRALPAKSQPNTTEWMAPMRAQASMA